MKYTKQRQAILNIFESTTELMSAEMIYSKLNDKSINLSTVYRTLDVFLKNDIITKTMIEHTAYYYKKEKNHNHYMICLKCHRKFPIECVLNHAYDELVNDANFKLIYHDLTLYGYCKHCQ